ncbi:MAG: sulfatase-like hydrolase/transferase [Anaerolineaceae bacterium]|nr:sulfatase-like hydrolase/transferase [Anaerolineaceae bacterium]
MEKLFVSNENPVSNSSGRIVKLLSWANLAALAALAIYFYVFMEWLFMVTKPSFMDAMPLVEKLGILLLCGLFLAAIGLFLLLVLYGISLLPSLSGHWKIFLYMGGSLPAIFIASTALLMIDNFTYTVFQFGIVTAAGIQRGLYGALFLILLAICIRWMDQTLSRRTQKIGIDSSLKAQLATGLVLMILSIPLGGRLYITAKNAAMNITLEGKTVQRPNILLIGSDGVDADHMSLYGAERDTTPFLKDFAKGALVAENNFPNASQTTGSLVSIYTGKLPTATRLLYPPDILTGQDAFQHFLGILKSEGYYNADVSVDYYADTGVLNLQNSFATVNGRSAYTVRLYTLASRYLPEDVAYFMSTIAKRLSDRIEHIFYIHTMVNPYAEVTQTLFTMSDQDRMNELLSLLSRNKQPMFVHVHFMATHGGNVDPKNRVFSYNDRHQTAANTMDFYDDGILDFDQEMSQVVDKLTKTGMLDKTMIIVYTDHGYGDTSKERIPLLIRFPNGEYAGKLVNNTQNIDIAPTILDYMGIQPPAWMSGQSLLKGEPPVTRPIFSATPNYFDHNGTGGREQLDLSKIKPPFYQFGSVIMVVCQKYYELRTSSLTWQEGLIPAYPTPCKADILPDDQQAEQLILDRLKTDGFDIPTTIQAALASKPFQVITP